MGTYKKFAGMLLVTLLSALVPLLDDNAVTGAEWINVAITLFGAGAVYGATNLPAGAWRYAKTIFAAGSAVLVIAASAITDGAVSVSELIQMALALGGALGLTPILNNTGSAPNGASTPATGAYGLAA